MIEKEVQAVNLSELNPAQGATKKTIRKGRGESSGKGKTSGRGNKGQNARSGGGVRPGLEDCPSAALSIATAKRLSALTLMF